MINKAIVLGDVHLGKSANLGKNTTGYLNSRIVDQLDLLNWTLNQAIDCLADNIILTGDIFEDPKPSIQIITAFINWLVKCRDNNIKIRIITGNHDVIRFGDIYISPLDIIEGADLDNVFVYKDVSSFTISNASFTMIPFRDRKSLFEETNEKATEKVCQTIAFEVSIIPNNLTKVAIGHLAIEGSLFIGDEVDDISNEIFLPLSLLEKFDYTWMGHVHKPQVLNKSPYIAHIGSMDISNFKESEEDKIIIIYNCDDNSFEEKIIPTRNLKKITIDIPKDVKDTTKYVSDILNKEKLKGSLVKIEINIESESLSVNKKSIEKLINEQGAFGLSGISEIKKTKVIKKGKSLIDSKTDVMKAVEYFAEKEVPKEFQDAFKSEIKDIYLSIKAEE